MCFQSDSNCFEKYLDADTLFDVKGMCQKAIEYLPKLAAGEKLKDV